jgi:hypothetical protein
VTLSRTGSPQITEDRQDWGKSTLRKSRCRSYATGSSATRAVSPRSNSSTPKMNLKFEILDLQSFCLPPALAKPPGKPYKSPHA